MHSPTYIALLAVSLRLFSLAAAKSQRVVILTDTNFDNLTRHGTWLVDVWAPWCPHCKDLEATWDKLADSLQGKVNVSKVDATVEKGLLHRFSSIQGFPAIFHVHGGETRQYDGQRTLRQLTEFALEGWKGQPALPAWQSPTSRLGYWLGTAYRLPSDVQRYYQHLHKDQGFSQLSLLAGLLAIPITLGLSLICLMDTLLTRRPNR